MTRNLLLSLLFICWSFFTKAQDNLIGRWHMSYTKKEMPSTINVDLLIGIPDQNIIYPSTLHIEYNGLNAEFQLILAKKNNGKLYLHSKKHPFNETPAGFQNLMQFFNGCFIQAKDLKGNSILKLEKLSDNENFKKILSTDSAFIMLETFLQNSPIELKKISTETPDKLTSDIIMHPKHSNRYLGLIDTIFVTSSDFSLEYGKNKDNDVVSLQLNGKTITDEIDSKKKRDNIKIGLDTGLNIFCFFAEDQGSLFPASGASVKLKFDHFNKVLSFKDTENINANFIAIRIYVQGNGDGNEDDKSTLHEIDRKYYEDSVVKYKYFNSDPGNLSQRESFVSGDYITRSPQLTFAIWDDAIEDGDSISLSVNDIWITRTFPVKKNPQFLTVNLKPGTNIITFAANNLGSIPPNTSVLEIIDGKKRKSFYIETDLNKNNLVKIIYDIN